VCILTKTAIKSRQNISSDIRTFCLSYKSALLPSNRENVETPFPQKKVFGGSQGNNKNVLPKNDTKLFFRHIRIEK
jgi:hypothetical protein